MGYSTTKIPFWSTDIEIKEVVSASQLKDFNIKKLKDLGCKRLAYSTLEEGDNGKMYLTMKNGDFVEFIEKK